VKPRSDTIGVAMPVRLAIWSIWADPNPLTEATLETEQLLEEMIVASPISDARRTENTGLAESLNCLREPVTPVLRWSSSSATEHRATLWLEH
jgi:hypothetical protein